MAEVTNGSNDTEGNKAYSTEEADMMATAKEYAKRDFQSVLNTFRILGIDAEEKSEELIAKALIKVKFTQIKKARTERPTFFD